MNNEISNDKLTSQQKQMIDMVINNLNEEAGLWKPGWRMNGPPVSAITGKKYKGANNFCLTFTGMSRNYTDNRWVTYNQMQEKGWKFKTDEEGNSLGKGAGVSIEFYELRDKESKRTFDRSLLDGMTTEEKEEYIKDNVYPIKRSYVVFNGDIIDGIPELEKVELNEKDRNERAETLLNVWSNNESKIYYGGDKAYYSTKNDTIHLPARENFYSMQEFYSTALHEIGHSTGHEIRLNRDIQNEFGSADYAIEELRAEIASMFIEQELGVVVEESQIRNNSEYIRSWKNEIENNPNALFTAIADANKICKYVLSKENEMVVERQTEYYSVVESENDYGNTVYTVRVISEYGQTIPAINYAFSSREAMMAEFENYMQAPAWKDKDFEEVSFERLQELSIERAEKEEMENNNELMLPSECVARAMPKKEYKEVDMTGRGIDSLTREADVEVVGKLCMMKSGEKFNQLYNGISILGNETMDERSLMTRLAILCGGDKEQLMRIFKSSGQYRDEKPNAFYDNLANECMEFVSQFTTGEVSLPKPKRRENISVNVKS